MRRRGGAGNPVTLREWLTRSRRLRSSIVFGRRRAALVVSRPGGDLQAYRAKPPLNSVWKHLRGRGVMGAAFECDKRSGAIIAGGGFAMRAAGAIYRSPYRAGNFFVDARVGWTVVHPRQVASHRQAVTAAKIRPISSRARPAGPGRPPSRTMRLTARRRNTTAREPIMRLISGHEFDLGLRLEMGSPSRFATVRRPRVRLHWRRQEPIRIGRVER